MKRKTLLLFLLAAMIGPLAANAQDATTLTVNDGTATNPYVPIYGYYVDQFSRSLFQIPASDLVPMVDGTISSMTFYCQTQNIDWGNGKWTVYVSETTEDLPSTFALTLYNSMTAVYTTGTLSVVDGMMTINFSSNMTYTGGNLRIGFRQTTKGDYVTSPWYGVNEGLSHGGYCSSNTSTNFDNMDTYAFQPKVTFTYIPSETPRPANVTVAHTNGATTAQVSWLSDAPEFDIDIDGTVTHIYDNQFTMTDLVMETTYSIKVRGDYNGTTTEWTLPISFTPTNLTNIGAGSGRDTDLPTNTTAKYSLTYQILTPEELGTPGNIVGLEFFNTSEYTVQRKLAIYMLYTDLDSFESEEDWVQVANGNLVFGTTGNTGGTAVTFASEAWTRITFTTPFDYDGGSNVLLVIDDNKNAAQDQCEFLTFSTSDDQALYFNGSTNLIPTAATMNYSSSNYSVSNYKNQIIVHKGNTPECPKPIHLAVTHAEGATTAEVSWQSDAESFNISVNGTVTSGVSNPYTLTDLVMETAYTIKVQGVCNGEAGDWSREYVFTPTNLAIVGEGNYTDNYLPTNTNYKYSITEQILTPEELGGAGRILGIDLFCTSEDYTAAQRTRTFVIYMVNTDKNSFVNEEDQVIVTSSNVVRTSTSVIFAENDWTHIEFSTPFDYDGQSNVLLVIDDNKNSAIGPLDFLSFYTDVEQSIYFSSNQTNIAPTGALNFTKVDDKGYTTSKNQIIVHKGNPPTCPKPIVVVNHENGATTAQVTCDSEAETFNISINGTVTEGVTLPYTLTDLVMESNYVIKLQADCGSDDLSDWSREYTFVPTNLGIAGEGNEMSDALPTNTNYNYSMTQQIFTPEEIGEQAPIKGVAFYNTGEAITRKLSIYMLNTDKDSFESVDDRVVVTSSNLVFGATSATGGTNVTFAADAWTYIPFTTTFDYDGGSNVILVVDDNTGNYNDGARSFLSFTTTDTQAMYFHDDNNNPVPTTAASSFDPSDYSVNSVTTDKSQVRFHKGNPPTCPKPNFITVNHAEGASTAEVSWQSEAETFNISINGTVTNGVTMPYTLTDLVMETNYIIKVQADCGGGETSDWSREYTFTPTNISIVGEGEENYDNLPTNTYYNYTLSQQIFTAEELGGEATIKGVSFYNDTDETVTRKLSLYMIATDKDSFESTDERVTVTSSNLVFGSASNTGGTNVTFAANSWTYITFTTAFDYDGGSNVILVVDDNTGSYADPRTYFRSFTTEENQAMYFGDDSNNPTPLASFDPTEYNDYNVTTSKNQVQFHKGNPPTCTRPVHFAVNYTGGRTAELSWESDAETFNLSVNNTVTQITENPYTLTDLALNTNYTVKVQTDCGGGETSAWSNTITFKTDQYEDMCNLYYTLYESYGDSWNGAKLLVKSGSSTLTTLTISESDLHEKSGTLRYENGKALSFVWNTGSYDTECSFVITDEWGQVICELEADSEPANNEVIGTYTMDCEAETYTLDIDGYGDSDGKWYLITSPVDFALVENVDNCIDEENEEDYDLYYFDQSQELEWINYKDATDGGFTLEPGKGYLYANKHDVTLTFTGHPYSGGGNNIPLTYEDGASWAGWNLVGNPLDVPADPVFDIEEGWYIMNSEGTEIILDDSWTPVQPMQAIFVYVTESGTMSFSAADSKGVSRSISCLSINVNQGRSIIDRAVVRFGEGGQMPKFQLNPNHTKVFIPQGGKDFAMVTAEEGMGELPVNFKAEKNGNYTLNSNAKEVNFSYLHLIDNMTGADIDLLANPSYSFDARTTDYASRFKLVFVCGDANDDNDFAFFSNGSWFISNEGDATVQVVDMMGRILSSESISGNASVNVNAASGVYMLRLVNGENVKVQKVVVR